MQKTVVVFLNGGRHGAFSIVCEGQSPSPPSSEDFEEEARRSLIASGSLTQDEGGRAKFVVQD